MGQLVKNTIVARASSPCWRCAVLIKRSDQDSFFAHARKHGLEARATMRGGDHDAFSGAPAAIHRSVFFSNDCA